MRSIRPILQRSRLAGVLLAAGILAVSASVAVKDSASAKSRDAAAVPCAPGTTTQTTSGPVCGIAVNGVNEWLGIPYAAPPVGNLRWQPPQPPAPWTTTLQATAFASECAQEFPGFPSGGSEDCLYVNVWRPADGSSNLPVMVHIHGGGFVIGSGQSDNTLLATTGHEVIVSMNYRLGIFGFLADSAFGTHSGDYGLQDQQAALRWVQHNITAFGGDPGNVTIFGESAGGSSVCDQIASPTAAGLFEHGISTSGEYNTLLGSPTSLESQDCKSALPTQAQAEAAGANYATAVGCAGVADVAACLRALPTATAEQAAGFGYQDGGQGTVAPTINGTTLTMTLRQELKTGHVNRVSVIAGTDRDENLVGSAATAAQFTQLVQTQYGKYAAKVLQLYPLDRFDSPGVAWRTVAADSDTVCPALTTDRDLARWMPVYAYEIDDNDIPPYTAAGGTAAGASHVGAWFLNPHTPALDANQQVLQNTEVAYVTTFAATGKPTMTNTPIWPGFTSASQEVMSLQPAGDSEIITAAEMSAQHNCSFWDKVAPSAG